MCVCVCVCAVYVCVCVIEREREREREGVRELHQRVPLELLVPGRERRRRHKPALGREGRAKIRHTPSFFGRGGGADVSVFSVQCSVLECRI